MQGEKIGEDSAQLDAVIPALPDSSLAKMCPRCRDQSCEVSETTDACLAFGYACHERQ